MADYCTQCSISLGAPEGWSDFGEGEREREVLCEGCGFTIIDECGRCIDSACACCPVEGGGGVSWIA